MGSKKAQLRTPPYHRAGSSRASRNGGTGTAQLRQHVEKKSKRKEPDETGKSEIKVRLAASGAKITGKYGVFLVQMPAVKNWAELDGTQLHQIVAELEVVTKGSATVTAAHVRLPEVSESAVGAGAPGLGFGGTFGGCVTTLHPGMQNRDLESFTHFLGGEDKVDGGKEEYEEAFGVATPFDARWSFAVGGKSALKVTELNNVT
ncbi:hypothetical protein LMH87_000031 [Akanthomyces muscarius]|uniref:Uncharacterized protein n=1 Tax=Akanthomyces muscarius TaxID=2231603 RepID=A0A9W8QDR9_AKAMU|nr:hypothetical protein LMH87_000031 [Akanthomyces muscarius]KAJ4154752.1 hypothetical protein LMH87_000031 [Akanthomyces muscarius]